MLMWILTQMVADVMEAGGGEDSDDDYEEEHLGDDFEDTPWVPPSADKALEYRQASTTASRALSSADRWMYHSEGVLLASRIS